MVSNHGDQCTNWGSLKLKSLSIAAVREELEFKVSHKLQTTVVGEKLLNLGGPVVSAFQVSCLALGGITHKTAPWIYVLNPFEGLWSHQYVNTVLTKTPEGTQNNKLNGLIDAWPKKSCGYLVLTLFHGFWICFLTLQLSIN